MPALCRQCHEPRSPAGAQQQERCRHTNRTALPCARAAVPRSVRGLQPRRGVPVTGSPPSAPGAGTAQGAQQKPFSSASPQESGPKTQGYFNYEPESSFQPQSKTSLRGTPRAFLVLRPRENVLPAEHRLLLVTVPQPQRFNTQAANGAGSAFFQTGAGLCRELRKQRHLGRFRPFHPYRGLRKHQKQNGTGPRGRAAVTMTSRNAGFNAVAPGAAPAAASPQQPPGPQPNAERP